MSATVRALKAGGAAVLSGEQGADVVDVDGGGDATVWLPQPRPSGLLAVGWTATGDPSELRRGLADLPAIPSVIASQQIYSEKCSRRDLNPNIGAISPDRGNRAIKVTCAGPTRAAIRRRVRCAAGAGVAVPASAKKMYGRADETDAELG
jgi:hypothetical protein